MNEWHQGESHTQTREREHNQKQSTSARLFCIVHRVHTLGDEYRGRCHMFATHGDRGCVDATRRNTVSYDLLCVLVPRWIADRKTTPRLLQTFDRFQVARFKTTYT